MFVSPDQIDRLLDLLFVEEPPDFQQHEDTISAAVASLGGFRGKIWLFDGKGRECNRVAPSFIRLLRLSGYTIIEPEDPTDTHDYFFFPPAVPLIGGTLFTGSNDASPLPFMPRPTSAPCPKCHVQPDQNHLAGCEIEQCPSCGFAFQFCSIHGCPANPRIRLSTWRANRLVPWSGFLPGHQECHDFGCYSRIVSLDEIVPCRSDDPHGHLDLARFDTSRSSPPRLSITP